MKLMRRNGLRNVIFLLMAATTFVGVGQAQSELEHTAAATDKECELDVNSCVDLMRQRFKESNRGLIGFLLTPVEVGAERSQQSTPKWRVMRVGQGTAAWDAGVRRDDVIVAWNGEELPPGSPEPSVRRATVGREIALTVERDGAVKELKIVPREPDDLSVEAWLLGYVVANFDRETLFEYRKTADPRLFRGQQPE